MGRLRPRAKDWTRITQRALVGVGSALTVRWTVSPSQGKERERGRGAFLDLSTYSVTDTRHFLLY